METTIEQLLESCQRNDRKAQYELYQRYAKAMYNICVRMVNDLEEAEDVLQEAFVRAFQSLGSFKGDSTFGAWLKRIVINQALNHLRKRKSIANLMENVEANEEAENMDEVDDSHLKVELIRKAIHQLPDGFRVVFTLYLIEGYDHQEIADILGVTVSTSKSQFNRAKNKVKQILSTMEVA